MTSPPTHPSPLEGEGWVGGIKIYCVCISITMNYTATYVRSTMGIIITAVGTHKEVLGE